MEALRSAMEARRRVDALLGAASGAEILEVRAVDAAKRRALAAAPSASALRACFPAGARVRVAEAVAEGEALPSVEEAQDELVRGRVALAVEDLHGRRFCDLPALPFDGAMVEAAAEERVDDEFEGSRTSAVGAAAGEVAAALRLADRCLGGVVANWPSPRSRRRLRALRLHEPDAKVLALLPSCARIAPAKVKRYGRARAPPKRATVRVGRANWTGDGYAQGRTRVIQRRFNLSYALGVEVLAASAVDVAPMPGDADEADLPSARLRCVGRLRCALDGRRRAAVDDKAPDAPLRVLPVSVLSRDLPQEQVRAVACSSRHTLVLAASGRVFACGDNEDGACGAPGDAPRVDRLAAAAWPDGAPVVVAAIAAGAAVATGLRNTKPVLRPQKVSFVEYGDDLPKIVDVAAGGSFGLALDEQRRAYAWGLWSGGRLGLGDTPTLERDARVDATRQRRAMFQLSPRAILRARPAPATRAPDYHRTGGEARDEKKPKADDDDDAAAAAADGDELEAALVDAPRWRSVACGEAHVLAVAEDGALYAWGSNAQGQLGLGPSHFFDFRDERRPTPVVPFCGGDLRVAVAACGATHSAVVDERGATWTWGGGGSRGAALGHGERRRRTRASRARRTG
ncbi:hypothetical protein JL721_3808 [Aureococcus anophagefferens]|nr:hypothetical protein JL721_3808 [Aureococcus anophagefferens]